MKIPIFTLLLKNMYTSKISINCIIEILIFILNFLPDNITKT